LDYYVTFTALLRGGCKPITHPCRSHDRFTDKKSGRELLSHICGGRNLQMTFNNGVDPKLFTMVPVSVQTWKSFGSGSGTKSRAGSRPNLVQFFK
jgi:hypothetical protein